MQKINVSFFLPLFNLQQTMSGRTRDTIPTTIYEYRNIYIKSKRNKERKIRNWFLKFHSPKLLMLDKCYQRKKTLNRLRKKTWQKEEKEEENHLMIAWIFSSE